MLDSDKDTFLYMVFEDSTVAMFDQRMARLRKRLDPRIQVLKMDGLLNEVPDLPFYGLPTLYWISKGKPPLRVTVEFFNEYIIKFIKQHSKFPVQSYQESDDKDD